MASEKKLTKKDLDKMAYMSLFEQSCFSFERMQAVGFAWGMSDCFRKIFGDNNEEMAKALQNNLDFINTEPHMAAILQGLVVSMEESGQDRELIHSLKTGLFGPLAGLGDAIWWYTAMPIIAGEADLFSSFRITSTASVKFRLAWARQPTTRISGDKLWYPG